MMRWVQAIWHRFEKIIRYLFCSIISTVFDVAIVWCLYHLAGVSLVVANTVGVVAGFLISYVLSARQVFETRYDAASFAIFFCHLPDGAGVCRRADPVDRTPGLPLPAQGLGVFGE